VSDRAFAPHCDPRILHAPGECEVCDKYSDWQELRKLWGIAFTGKPPEAREPFRIELPCPADYNRGQNVHRWFGNRPVKTSTT